MIVIDASVFVSWLLPSDTFHAVSRQWGQHYLLTGGRLVAPNIVVTEVAAAIARRTRDTSRGEKAAHYLLRIPALRLVQVDDYTAMAATRLATGLFLKGADAVYVAVAEQLNIPLVSWDDEHHTRAGSNIVVQHPTTTV